ncbi:recombinase family protein [Paenibacillus sp. FSL L8-0506]|uniref:recombinase family protein n=1 Tax=Paenibacillus sp. FSL L8-0506 TaxID=2975335 RepID=UPI0030F60159
MGQRAVGYVRVSTYGQMKDGYSLAYQREEIVSYCQKHEIELVDIYEDQGQSGATVDEEGLTVEREGLQDLLADLKYHHVQLVVVLNTSRLWRSDMAKVLIQRELKRNHIDVKAIEQPNYSIYASDPNDFLINGMMELLDQYQRLEITMKLSRGRKKKAEQGGYAGGGVPYGYSCPKGQKELKINLKEASAILRLFELRELFPSWSLSKYAFQLNYDGFSTAKDKPFTKVQVKRILDREDFYKGFYCYGEISSIGHYSAII